MKTLLDPKPCAFSGKVASVVADGGSLFPRVRPQSAKVVDKNAQDCSESSIFSSKCSKTLSSSELFSKMRSARRARECSESSVSHENHKKLKRSEHFWKMRLAKCAQECSESSICISMNLFCISKLQKN